MPIFEYECRECGKREDVLSGMVGGDDSPPTCPVHGAMKKNISAMRFVMSSALPMTRGQHVQQEWEKTDDYKTKLDQGKYRQISGGELRAMDDQLAEETAKEAEFVRSSQ